MINKQFLFTNLCMIVCMLIGSESFAQRKWFESSSNKSTDPYLQKQWFIGVRGGINITSASVAQRFSSIASTVDPTTTEYDKDYSNFSVPGGQAGLEFVFKFKDLSFSFQPNYRRQSFSYTNDYSWSDPDSTQNTFSLHYDQLQKLDYFEFPLLIKYEPIKTTLRPFVQAGAYYGLLDNAYKSTIIKAKDVASGSNTEYESQNLNTGDSKLFLTSSWGFIMGIGVSYPVGNIRLVLDLNYRQGMNNITNAANRYSIGQLAGTGDIMDDLKLRNFSLSFGALFPLKFLKSSTYWAE